MFYKGGDRTEMLCMICFNNQGHINCELWI